MSELNTLFTDIVSYIELTQDIMEKKAAADKKLKEKVAYAVDTLVSNRLVAPEDRNNIVSELGTYPEKIAELLVKVSNHVGPETLGGASEKVDASALDPIIRFVLES